MNAVGPKRNIRARKKEGYGPHIKGISPLLFWLITCTPAPGQEFTISGQAIGWAVASKMDAWRGQAGLRYLPKLEFQSPVKENFTFDAEASANIFGSGLYWNKDSTIWEGRVKPYRIWARFSGDQFEVRAGLQKINFGSAAMLRPLMWFDQIDPRDTLQLTDGVYGILGRYYFLNNTNIWLWVLYGNDKQKGWEIIPSVKNKPEIGGRVQFPVPNGELATTYHYRVADVEKVYSIPHGEKAHAREKRLALDGKFDVGVGLWFEAALTHQEIHLPEYKYKRALSLGLDYTFGLGSGLNLMTEFFTFGYSEQAVTGGESLNFSALSANYQFSIFTGLNAIVFYDWTNHDLYNFVNWSWQFDDWSFYIMGFWNPEQFNIYQGLEGANLYAGKGLQLMIVFNH
jgi:hypothetical protein